MFDLLFPTFCINCGKPGKYLCSICQKKLRNTLPECYVCRRISPQYLTHTKCNKWGIKALFVGWQYDDITKKILGQYKYRYAYKLSKIITDLLLERLKNTHFIDLIGKNSVLVPTPSHRSHIRERGFNQSLLIARELSEKLNIPIKEDSLVRDRDKRYQAQLPVHKRQNLKDVFTLKKDIHDKEILLIDDVVTTGSTLNKAASSFKNKNIKAIALFRGRPHYHQ